MRASAYLGVPRQAPKDRVNFERYLIELGLIHHHASGIYVSLPLLKLMVRNIEDRFRSVLETELEGSEIELPLLQREQMFDRRGRLALFGDEIFRVMDQRARRYVLSPTSEEIFAELVLRDFAVPASQRLTVFQIDRKYRDERGGGSISRTREFRMIEAYTLHPSESDVWHWKREVEIAMRSLYDDLGCELVVQDSPESVTSALSGMASTSYQVRSNVRTGQEDEDGNQLLDLAKWSPLGTTYLAETGQHLSCLGAGAIRVLLHLFERSQPSVSYQENGAVEWPDIVLPIQEVVFVPDEGGRFSPFSERAIRRYHELRHLGTAMMDDRVHVSLPRRREQFRRLGVRHAHIVDVDGTVVREPMAKRLARP